MSETVLSPGKAMQNLDHHYKTIAAIKSEFSQKGIELSLAWYAARLLLVRDLTSLRPRHSLTTQKLVC